MTCGVLVLLLLAIYRSPLVALVPLLVVGIAYVVAGGLTYMLVDAGVTSVSGQTTAILIVLMFGAGTDYCLLIVARFRDELRRTADVGEAMARATERTGPAILSAGAIVIVAMLVLALADFNATREMGPILALGVAVMVVAGLTLLPAILGDARPALVLARGPAREARAAPVGVWAASARLVGAPPGGRPRRRHADPGGGRARQPGRARDARLLGGVPRRRPSRCGRAADRRALHPRPRGAGQRRHSDAGAASAVIAELTDGLSDACTGDVPDGGVGPAEGQESELVLAEAYLKMDPFSDEATDAVPGAAPRGTRGGRWRARPARRRGARGL